MNNTNQSPSKSVLPYGISWCTIVLALLAIITFFAISNNRPYYATSMGGGAMEYSGRTSAVAPDYATPPMDMSVSNQGMKGMDAYYPYPYPNPEVPSTDTREFLKTYYSAYMRTRNVPDLTRRVVTTVRGYDGRIDQESSSQRYGSIGFALSKAKYDAFRNEIEGLVGQRFIKIDVSSQNLLSQKVSIEEQQKQADTSLAEYKTARQKIVSAHASAVKTLQSKINVDTAELAVLRSQPATPTVLARIQVVSDDLAFLNKQLANENASYTEQLARADQNIKYGEDWQKAVVTQDKALLDNVGTVTGTISIQWISLWDIVQLYLPGYWIPAIFLALTLVSIFFDRRRLNNS